MNAGDSFPHQKGGFHRNLDDYFFDLQFKKINSFICSTVWV